MSSPFFSLILFFVLLNIGAAVLIIILVTNAKRRNQNAVKQNYTAPVNAQPVQNTQPVQNAQPNNNTSNIANELSSYKNMYESGLITEEEYNQKKKQILGI